MSRSVFLILAGIIGIFFGGTMIFNSAQMLDMVAIPTNQSTSVVLQWMGCPLIAIGLMNILARRDAGSIALRAIMIGNILLHVFGMAIDVYDYRNAFIKISGLEMGAVVHLILIAGFLFYYLRLGKEGAR